jgi:hypothetical protein
MAGTRRDHRFVKGGSPQTATTQSTRARPAHSLSGARALCPILERRGDGLPAEHAYLTVLRQVFSGARAAGALYFGCTSGELFGSGDAGLTWSTIAFSLVAV